MKPWSPNQSNNSKATSNYHNNGPSRIQESKPRIKKMAGAPRLVVKCLLTVKPAIFIPFFRIILYLLLGIIDSVANNATD